MAKTPAAPKTLQEAIRYFADPDTCLAFMVEIRWPDGVTCPTCGSAGVSFLSTRRVWKCKANHPKRQFSAKVGTIFEDSPIGLDKWFAAMWLLANAKNGISSYEIGRALGVTQKTGWFMLHRLRLALKDGGIVKLSGRVEADETFIGPDTRKMHADKREKLAATRVTDANLTRAIVAGVLERGVRNQRTSRVRAQVVPDVRAASLGPLIRQHVEEGSEMITDMNRSYWTVRPEYIHSIIDKTVSYVKGHVHTNGMENFWSLLKRMLRGTYVAVEHFHLGAYVDEEVFRFNERSRKDSGRFVKAMQGIMGKRLTYAALTT